MTGLIAIGLIAALVAGLVISEMRDLRGGSIVFKPLASVGFLVLAVWMGALEPGHTYGPLIFAGLVLSFFGDVFLLAGDQPRFFLAGLGSFLLGHVAYAAAFLALGIAGRPVGVAIAVLVPVAFWVWRWLRPHLPPDMVGPVIAYVVVISVMESLAMGASFAVGFEPGSGGIAIALGATLFCVSDLAVARRQFVDPSPASSLWGLPLYYAGQVGLALSVVAGRPISS